MRVGTAQPWQSPAPGDVELCRALDALRHAGRDGALALVGERLWRDGDAGAITAALSNARREGWWTPSTARAHLSLLAVAGDLLEEADADATVTELLEMIDHPKEFSVRYRSTFDPRYFGLQSLAVVMPAASMDCQVMALERVLKIQGIETGQLAIHLRQGGYPVVAGSSDRALLAVEQTLMNSDWVGGEDRWPFLAVLRGRGSAAAAVEMAAEFGSGNLLPLQVASDFDLLSSESLLRVINGEAQACEGIVDEAATIGPPFGSRGISAARLLAANLRSPEHARWEPLHALLAEMSTIRWN